MVRIVEGNLLDSNSDIIAHQVNCMGVMGRGVAGQIRSRYPHVYEEYRNFCVHYRPLYRDQGDTPLGKVQYLPLHSEVGGPKRYIANLFGQFGYGSDGHRYTDYLALRSCLNALHRFARKMEMSVALPYGIGCGLGGGDWSEVFPIIQEELGSLDVTIYKLPQQ